MKLTPATAMPTTQNNCNQPNATALLATAVILGVLATSFSAIFLNIALPALIDDLAIAAHQSHWLISVFIVAATLSMLLVSTLISHFSLRNTFIGFLVLFTAASLVGGSLTSLWPMIACRAIQGTAMGVLSVVAIISLFEAYPIERRGYASAIFGLGVAMGPTFGPTLSGILVDTWGWRATFYTPILLSVISLLLCVRVLPKKRIESNKKLDVVGFILLTVIIIGLLSGLDYLQAQHWPLLTTGLAALCLLALLLTLGRQQLRCPEPLLQLGFFKYPIFTAIAFVSFIYGMGLWGSAFLLPLYLQQAVGLSVWDTGMVMLPSGLFLCLTLPFGGRMADGIPARYVVSLGLLSLSCSFLLLGLGVGHDSFIAIAALIVLSRGLGLGLMIPSLDATATRALPAEEMAEAVALMNFIRQLGGALSPTLLSMLLYWRIQANAPLFADPLAATRAGYSEALLGLAVMFGLSLLAAWQLPRHRFSH